MQDISDEEALGLFEEYQKQQQQEVKQDEDLGDEEGVSRKRLKKHRKDKKKHKKRHRELEELDDQDMSDEDERNYKLDAGLRAFVEEEADEDSEQQSELNSSAEFEEEEQRRQLREFYKVDGRRHTEQFLNNLKGKDEAEVNRYYQKRAIKRRDNEAMLPSTNDFKMFYVSCKQGKQQEMVMSILNKTAYYQRTQNEKFKMEIGTAMALKKKYPGKIFIEAVDQKAIKSSLQGFIDVNVSRVTPMDHQFYSNLFEASESKEITFYQGQYVRITKGVYEGDLGKISRVKKATVDVVVVPRINIQDILSKMREESGKTYNTDRELIEKKDQILKKYTNHRNYYPSNLRPPKKPLPLDIFRQFSDLPSNKKITITPSGLIQFTFRQDQITKPEGTMLPIELQFFTKNGNIGDEMLDEDERKNFNLTIKVSKGQDAQVVAGQLTGCYGIIMEVKQNTAIIKCKNKQMAGKLIQDHIDHICKRFKESQRVKVVSGTQKGKTGIVIKLEGPYAQIWTDNQNSIKINKNNLEAYLGQAIASQNLLGLKKDDLIKTAKGNIGVIISTNKDNIKMLDVSNVISIVNNLDYQSKMNTKNLIAKNRFGDQIKNQTIVRIRSGIHDGVRCEVKHIYRDYLFLFNPEFDKTSGITVQKADNCTVVAKNLDYMGRGFQKGAGSKPNNFNNNTDDEDLKVGRSITIGSGPLKGYRGIIKSINKDRIQVRIPQKNCTEWIQRDKITQTDSNLDHGKTPRRGLSMTAMYAQSPMNF